MNKSSSDTLSPEARVPSFLTGLDARPAEAFQEFYAFARAHLCRVPPGPLRNLPEQDREDFLHDIVLHCVRDDFRVLRRYRDCGQSFAGWFHVVAFRLALAHARRKGLTQPLPASGIADTMAESPQRVRLLGRVRELLVAMDTRCRQLLLLAAEEYSPRDMVRALGLPAASNKKVGDQVRECRKKLKAQLDDEGVNWQSCLQD